MRLVARRGAACVTDESSRGIENDAARVSFRSIQARESPPAARLGLSDSQGLLL